ncbi:hypothetical protein [Streptomyces paromomycinus]|uniref:hypothetical protein n=1 Tax=Streptomyces paromomycinus TaxID=92743 RepID=UPI001478DC10|nr:hypothetical protein [Streptomyces paromomycinus]
MSEGQMRVLYTVEIQFDIVGEDPVFVVGCGDGFTGPGGLAVQRDFVGGQLDLGTFHHRQEAEQFLGRAEQQATVGAERGEVGGRSSSWWAALARTIVLMRKSTARMERPKTITSSLLSSPSA